MAETYEAAVVEEQRSVGLDFETAEQFSDWIQHRLLLSQHLFIFSEAYDSALITGVGSGKTAALVAKTILLSMMNPNNMGLIGRDTEKNLIDTTQKDFFEICPKDILLPGTRKGRNGKAVIKTVGAKPSTIVFRHFRQAQIGVKHLSGMNLGFYAVDQAEDVTEEEYDYPHTRLRRSNINSHRSFRILNAKGHDWNWQRSIQPAEDAHAQGNLNAIRKHKVRGYNDREVEVTEYWASPQSHAIVSYTHENFFLPPGYIESIEQNQSREYIQRYLYSSFDEWGGKIYKSFFPGSPHVIDPFKIPDDWPCVVSIDVGGDSPWAILTGRFDPHYGDCFITHEYYEPGVLIDDIAAYLSDKERSGIPDIFNPATRIIIDPENKPVVSEFQNKGLIVEIAKKHNKAGSIMRVAGYMQPKKGRTREIPGQEVGKNAIGVKVVEDAPHCWVFRTCENYIREHRGWMSARDPRTNLATDQPVDENDHTCDAQLYMLRIRPDVKDLPKNNPVLDRLRRAHYGSYAIYKQELEDREKPKRTYGSQLFGGEPSRIVSPGSTPEEWRRYL